jgi:hypothetical protein
MKTRLLIIIVFALIPFVFLNVDASCDKNVGSADESCTPAELLEICDTLWSPRYDGSPTPGNIFCNAVYDLDLNESDVEKLGIHLDWENYAIQSSKDFVDDWGFYQDHAIRDTLLIHPSISMRDSFPPAMKVQISFDYIDESEIKIFDESLMIYMKYNYEIVPLPENTWVIMPQEELDVCGPDAELVNGVCEVIVTESFAEDTFSDEFTDEQICGEGHVLIDGICMPKAIWDSSDFRGLQTGETISNPEVAIILESLGAILIVLFIVIYAAKKRMKKNEK